MHEVTLYLPNVRIYIYRLVSKDTQNTWSGKDWMIYFGPLTGAGVKTTSTTTADQNVEHSRKTYLVWTIPCEICHSSWRVCRRRVDISQCSS